MQTWTTLTVQSRERGMVAMIKRMENKVIMWAQMLGPSSHAEDNYVRLLFIQYNSLFPVCVCQLRKRNFLQLSFVLLELLEAQCIIFNVFQNWVPIVNMKTRFCTVLDLQGHKHLLSTNPTLEGWFTFGFIIVFFYPSRGSPRKMRHSNSS